MIILRILAAFIGLIVILTAIIGFFSGINEELGLFSGLIGAAIVFFIFGRESVSEFFSLTNGFLEDIAFGTMIGGGILCSMEISKIGNAVLTSG